MLTLKEYMNEAKKKDPCWSGYKMIGMKDKEGKKVPNCVPEEIEKQVSEAIQYNIENDIPLSECVYRRESEMFNQYFNYLREHKDAIELDIFGKTLIESDLGTTGLYEGEEVPLDLPFIAEEEENVELGKPKRGGPKKFYVYVKNDKGNVVKVSFGDTSGLTAKINDPEARKSFAARHNCDQKKDRTTPGYWSCNLPRYAKALGLSGGGSYYW